MVAWPEASGEGEPSGLHWKTRSLMRWAGGRPFAWFDDEIAEADRARAAVHHPARTFLHRVDHRHGLTSADFGALDGWLPAG